MEQISTEIPVYIVVDSSQSVRSELISLISGMHLRTRVFESGEEFLASRPTIAGIMIYRYQLRGMNGLELQLNTEPLGLFLPSIMISGPIAPRVIKKALQNGCVDVVDEPISVDEVRAAVQAIVGSFHQQNKRYVTRQTAKSNIQALRPKDHEVLNLMLKGTTNKNIAYQLDVSIRTVEARRQRIFRKMNATSLVELVRLVDLARDL